MMSWLKKHKEKVIGTTIGIVLLVVLVRQISFEDVIESIALISWDVFLYIIALTIAVYGFRALRFYILFNRDISLKRLFYIVCAHNLANNVLPARIGELSFIYLSKRSSKLTVPYITTSLLVVRFLDLFVTLLFFVVFLSLLDPIPPILFNIRWVALAGIAGLVGMTLLLMKYQERIAARLNSKDHVNKWKKKISHFFLGGLHVTRLLRQRPRFFVGLLVLTLGIWGIAFYSTFVLTSAMEVPLSYVGIAIGTTFVVLTSTLPINSFLGIGVYEGAWTLALVLLGIPKELAITSGVTLHIIRIITYFLFGSLGVRLFIGGEKSPDSSKVELAKDVLQN